MTTTYIYALIDPRDGATRYVGKTVNMKVRLAQHMADSSGSRRKQQWLQELKALAFSPEVKIFAEVDSEDCFQEEKSWIKTMIDNGCDLVNGNMGCKGTTTKRSENDNIKLMIDLTESDIQLLDILKQHMGLSSRSLLIRSLLHSVIEIYPARAIIELPSIQPKAVELARAARMRKPRRDKVTA